MTLAAFEPYQMDPREELVWDIVSKLNEALATPDPVPLHELAEEILELVEAVQED